MAVPYHTHTFDIPTATPAEVATGTEASKAVTPAAMASVSAAAASAVQPGDLGNSAPLDVGTTAGTVAAGDDERIVNATQPADINPRLDNSGITRPYLARDKDKPWGLEEFGTYGSASADHSALIQAALDSSAKSLLVPHGKTFNVNTTLRLTSSKSIVGGWGSSFKSQRTDRTLPMFIVDIAASGSTLRDIVFDHNAQGVPEPSLSNALSLALLSPALIMADDVSVENCQFLNSWDNGLGVGRYSFTGDGSAGNPYSTTQTIGSPKGVRVRGSYAYNCGIGEHVTGTPGRIGVGFSALTGSQTIFEGCAANFCHTGFATDFGGQAGASFINCISRSARANAAGTNGGNGFYLADGPVTLSGCQALFGDGIGFEIPKEANGVSLSSCYSFANKKNGYFIGSSYSVLSACISQSDSLGNNNIYDAFYLNPYAENMVGVQLVGCMAFGTDHRYGWASNSSASFTCDAAIIGGYFTGVSGAGNKAGKAISYLDMSLARVRANPLGGSLEILGSWDNPLKTATSWIFVDDVGRLRIKTSATAPTSFMDGTIVGTQT